MARYSPRAIVVTIAVLIFLFYPANQAPAYAPSSAERARAADNIERQWHNLAYMNQSHYGDFVPIPLEAGEPSRWLNMTGLRHTDGFAWDLLRKAQTRARTHLERAAGRQGLDILYGESKAAIPLYRNITGDVRGTWVRSSIEQGILAPTNLNLSTIAPEASFASAVWERNITGREGHLQIRFAEEENERTNTENASAVSAAMAIQDDTSSGGGWDVSLHGVHLKDHGSIILTTRSGKFSGMYGLPHFGLSTTSFGQMQSCVNFSVSAALETRQEELNAATSVELDLPSPKCEMIMYLQQQQFMLGDNPPKLGLLLDIEHELRFPSGNQQTAPPLVMSMVLFSPDCGFALESKGPPDWPLQQSSHLRGHKSEVYQRIIRNVLLTVSILMAVQLWLLIQQMRASSTPSRQSKIAIRTLTMLAMGDYVVLLLASFLIPVVDTLFITLMVAIFFAIIGGSLIPNKFLLEIWNSQEPERIEAMREVQRRYASERAEREAQAAANPSSTIPAQAPASTNTPLAASSLPTVASTPPTATPRPLPMGALRFTDASASALSTVTPPAGTGEPRLPTFGTLYTTNALLLFAIFFLTAVALTTFPRTLLYIYTRGLSLIYLSPWVPQIIRSARRSTTRALSMQFVAGQSVLRLVPFIWLWGRPEALLPGKIFAQLGLGGGGAEVLNVQPDPPWIFILAAWLWMQCCVLAGQEVIGPRWFTWRGWPWAGNLPHAWDWADVDRLRTRTREPPRNVDEEEAGQRTVNGDSGVAETEALQPVIKVKSNDERTFECAVCMQDVDVPLSGQSNIEVAGSVLLGGKRRDYMITPCGHVFHAVCLERWMGYRLQCPICREGLPPL